MLLGHATDMCSEQVAFFFSLPKSPDELQGGVGRTSSCMRLCSTRSYDAVYLVRLSQNSRFSMFNGANRLCCFQ